MLKWLTITLLAIVVFVTLLLGLGYLLKEHETATTQLKLQLDQKSAQQKAKEARRRARFKPAIETSMNNSSSSSKRSLIKGLGSKKQQILLENLTCTSTKQCLLIDIQFADLSCAFAINTIGASLMTKVVDDFSSVGKCPIYPKNSKLSCELNICSYTNSIKFLPTQRYLKGLEARL
jgi:hypothetical protein